MIKEQNGDATGHANWPNVDRLANDAVSQRVGQFRP